VEKQCGRKGRKKWKMRGREIRHEGQEGRKEERMIT
jgi:hypothetical protein